MKTPTIDVALAPTASAVVSATGMAVGFSAAVGVFFGFYPARRRQR